jgi:RNA polymerase sigma factor (sigma-70 family)
MASGEILKSMVQHFRTQFGDAPTDLELLSRYARQHDEAAFATLVRRHGGLVFGVAHRQLADRQQAEDVFQATFLALARSAPRLGRQASLANWLYTVALRQARKARRRAAQRTALEKSRLPPSAPPADPLAEMSGRELVSLIDDELSRLPERYRLPLLLCCVQGLSREEAARQLGWSDGAVKGRLERGRRQLAARLARRGLAPSALLLAPLAEAAVPNDLLARTAVLAAAPWSKSLPAAVVSLATAGAPSKLLPAALLALLLGVGLLGLAAGTTRLEPGKTDPPPPAAPVEANAGRLDDPLPAGSVLRFGTARFRQGTNIERLAVSPDDRVAIVATGGHWTGAARAFDLTTGRVLYELDRRIWCEALALSPDGRTLATSEDRFVHLREAATGKEFRKIALPTSNPWSASSWLTFSPDGQRLAIGGPDGKTIVLLDVRQGKVVRTFQHTSMLFAAAFSPDGQQLAGGGYDFDAKGYFSRLWDVATGKELRRFRHDRDGLRTLAFAPDGATLAGGDDGGRLRLWDVATGQVRRKFPPDGYRIRAVAFTPDGRTVAAAGDSIRLYDVATGQERLRIRRQANDLHFSADGTTLFGTVAGAIYRWDATTGRPLTPHEAGDSVVNQVLATPDGRRVITHDQDNQIHLWDAATGKHLRRLEGGWQMRIAVSPDSRWLASSVADPSVKYPDPEDASRARTGTRIRLYDLAADQFVDRFPGYAGEAHDLAFSPDSQTLLSFNHTDGSVRLWDVAAGKERRKFRVVRDGEAKRSFQGISQCVLSPDGRTLAVACHRSDNSTARFRPVVVRLWDLGTGKELHELKGHVNQVQDVAFSPDSRLLVACSENAFGFLGRSERSLTDQVLVWDVATGRPVAALPKGLPIGASHVAFAPDGRTLATASADGALRLWEVLTWTERAAFRGHRDGVSALAFGGPLLSGGHDTTVLAWGPRPPKVVGKGPLTAAWDELAQTEAAPAFRAQGRLRASPAEAVALFRARLQPVAAVEAKRRATLIADLDSPNFAVRQQATAALKQLGGQAVAALREAEEKSGSLEMRRRAGALLAEFEKSVPLPEELRALRAVELLEWIATPEACALLTALAKGGPGARLTSAAEAALQRLSRGR